MIEIEGDESLEKSGSVRTQINESEFFFLLTNKLLEGKIDAEKFEEVIGLLKMSEEAGQIIRFNADQEGYPGFSTHARKPVGSPFRFTQGATSSVGAGE